MMAFGRKSLLMGYAQALSTAYPRDVWPHEFEEAAMLAGWDQRTVALLLLPPMPTERFLVGNESLRIK